MAFRLRKKPGLALVPAAGGKKKLRNVMTYIFIVKKAADFDPWEAACLVRRRTGVNLNSRSCGSLGGCRGALFAALQPECGPLLKKFLLEEQPQFDLLVLPHLPYLGERGGLILDMDMTSVQIEGIDEIARRLGVYDRVAAITAEAMRGGLDFASSLRKRVAMLKGGNAAGVLEQVKGIMTETPGLRSLLQLTHAWGWARGICSGGFVQLIGVLERRYSLELVRANSLEIKDGKFTGAPEGEVVDAEAKRRGVMELKQRYALKSSQVIVLGDGANDLRMIREAGLGIAYHAKELVRREAPCALNHSDLSAVALLLVLGMKSGGCRKF